MAKKYDKTPAQIFFKFLHSQNIMILSGTKDVNHVIQVRASTDNFPWGVPHHIASCRITSYHTSFSKAHHSTSYDITECCMQGISKATTDSQLSIYCHSPLPALRTYATTSHFSNDYSTTSSAMSRVIPIYSLFWYLLLLSQFFHANFQDLEAPTIPLTHGEIEAIDHAL